jgi:hypothetical protein
MEKKILDLGACTLVMERIIFDKIGKTIWKFSHMDERTNIMVGILGMVWIVKRNTVITIYRRIVIFLNLKKIRYLDIALLDKLFNLNI